MATTLALPNTTIAKSKDAGRLNAQRLRQSQKAVVAKARSRTRQGGGRTK